MTIKELYQWAKENNVADYDIAVQYRDSGGFYYGEDTMIEPDIDSVKKEVIL